MITPKRPRDPNRLAKFIVDVATGEADDTVQAAPKVKLSEGESFAREGGLARARALSPEARKRIAREAATKRWAAKSN